MHPFVGAPQHEQIYGPHRGPRIGRNGNGLGMIWGSTGSVDSEQESDDADILGRRPRMSNSHPVDQAIAQEVDEEDDTYPWIEDVISHLIHLPAKQQFVIRMRYGILDGAQYTLEEIAEFMGITHQSVRGLEQRALEKLQFLTSGGRGI